MANLSNINNKFIVESDGDVGIGVTTALDKLNVGDGNIRISQVGNVASQLILNTYQSALGNTTYKWFVEQTTSANSYSFQIGNGTTPYLHINSLLFGAAAGNVGIGTDSPGTKLEVKMNDTANNRLGFTGDGSTTGSAMWTNWQTGNSYLDFRLGGTTDTYTKMRITSDGNVGIGTTNPSDGNLVIKKDGVNTGITNVLMNASFSEGGGVLKGLSIGYRTDETTAVLAPRTATGNLAFYSYDGGWSESMRITNSGNVGIGTVSPNYKLSVANASTRIISATYIDGTNGIMSHAGAPNYGLESFQVRGDFISFWTDYDASHYQGTEKMRIWSGGMIQIGNDSSATPELLTLQAYTQNQAFSGKYSASGYLWFLRNETGPSGRFQLYNAGSTTINLEGNTTRDSYILGDLGIGTTSPTTLLNTLTTANSENMTLGSAANMGFKVGNTSTNVYGICMGVGDSGRGWIQVGRTDGTAIAYDLSLQASGGNVGIGVTDPDSRLEIKGAGATTGLTFKTTDSSGNTGFWTLDGGATGVHYYPLLVNYDYNDTRISSCIFHAKGATGVGLFVEDDGNVGIGTTSPGDARLYVNGGTTLGGSNNSSEGATRIFGDRKFPQANNFVRRNYNLTASAGGALYSIARQWHDTANWGLGNINVIMWGIYYGRTNFSKADFSCRYGYSGNVADVEVNFNPGGLAVPSWTAATQVSGNIYYRDLRIQLPAYTQISFEIISPGLHQTYNVNNTANNTVYLYPH